MYNSSMLLVVI